MDFVGFNKIPRLSRTMIVTEKLDGTNAQIAISDDGLTMKVGSRTRWIKPGDDNFGFAMWAHANRDELLKLGPGHHFGEWWGKGIQRGYGLDERRFSLFNVTRWEDDAIRPSCCHVVPTLYRGEFDTTVVSNLVTGLRVFGSRAAPGFMKPEGVIVFHEQGGLLFKKTTEGDGRPKSMVNETMGWLFPKVEGA